MKRLNYTLASNLTENEIKFILSVDDAEFIRQIKMNVWWTEEESAELQKMNDELNKKG